jgi:hypothetical protein
VSLPEGVQTAALSFGAGFDALGGNVGATLTIEVVFPPVGPNPAPDRLVWAEDGRAFFPFDVMVDAASPEDALAPLPVVDQGGWLDQFGNEYSNWYYRATLRYTKGNQSRQLIRLFQPVMGTTVVDMDTIFADGGVEAPVAYLRYPVRSVNGVEAGPDGNVDLGDLGGGETGTGSGVDQTARDAAQQALEVAQGRYLMPAGGIPSTALDSAVRSALSLAGTAYQLPGGGIPGSQLAPAFRQTVTDAQTTATNAATAAAAARTVADAAYVKPGGGIGTADLSTTVVGWLNLAQTAVQPAAMSTALAAKADLVNGVLPTSQLPPISTSERVVVASQAAMLALTSAQVQRGDLAIRTDGAGTFILGADDPSVLENWSLLNSPTDKVSSVNGQSGAIVLGKSDIGLGNVDNTSDANKPVSTAQQAALDGKSSTGHGHTASAISDSTVVGRSVLTAASQAAGRTALGITGTGADGAAGAAGAQGAPGGFLLLPQGVTIVPTNPVPAAGTLVFVRGSAA